MKEESRTFDEWKAIYKEKTGKEFIRAEQFKLFFFPEKGFCEIGILKDMVVAYQLCGEGWFWRRVLEILAMSLNMSHCGTICIRHIKPYIRFWGYKVERAEETEDGKHKIYHCRDARGKYLKCSPAWEDNETGETAYFMTWEV